jgi:hypothetical protein
MSELALSLRTFSHSKPIPSVNNIFFTDVEIVVSSIALNRYISVSCVADDNL